MNYPQPNLPEFPGYAVDEMGNVFCWRKRNGNAVTPTIPRRLRSYLNGPTKSRYYCVTVRNASGQWKLVKVSRLVLLAHVGPRPKDMQILHGVRGRFCDELTNLAWGTLRQNYCDDMIRDGTIRRGHKHPLVKLTEMAVRVIRRSCSICVDGGLTTKELGAVFGVHPTQIGYIAKRKCWAWLP